MKNLFQENRNVFLFLLTSLLLLLFIVYILFYRPLVNDLKEAKNEENILSEEILLLESQEKALLNQGESTPDEIENIKMEDKLPVSPELESFLLTLNEIELVSESRIDGMSFGYEGNLPDREPADLEADSNNDTDEEQSEEEIDTEAAEEIDESENQEPVIEIEEMPEGLQPIIVTLDVQSPDYEHFQLLLKEIEKQERVMFVSYIEFNKPAEQELVIEGLEDETISAKIDITLFYFEQ